MSNFDTIKNVLNDADIFEFGDYADEADTLNDRIDNTSSVEDIQAKLWDTFFIHMVDDSNIDNFDVSKLSEEQLEEAKEAIGEPEFFHDLAQELHAALSA